jgi:hypothetical protein
MSIPISAMEDDEDGRFCFKPEINKSEIVLKNKTSKKSKND